MPRTAEQKLTMIRNLMDKAADPATTSEEAQALQERAETLMLRYGWDEASLPESQRADDGLTSQLFALPNPYGIDKRQLLFNIAHVFGCKSLVHKSVQGQQVQVFGFQSDLAKVELLYTSLVMQALGQMRRAEMPKVDRWWSVSRTTFNKSWLAGFSRTIYLRLKAAHQKIAEEHRGTGAELVVADRTQRIERFFADSTGRTRKVKAPTRSDVGYGAGTQAGERADIGLTRVGGTRQQLQG